MYACFWVTSLVNIGSVQQLSVISSQKQHVHTGSICFLLAVDKVDRIVMAEALGRPPSLQAKVVDTVLCKYFHFKKVLEDSIKPLPSFEDHNIYFEGETTNSTCSEFVLKLSNPMCTPTEVIKGINAMMKYVQECKFKFLTSYPLPSENGTDVVHLTAKELAGEGKSTQSELQYHVQVFPFIAGEVLDSVGKQYMTPTLLQEVGEMIGKLNKELKVR